MFIDISNKPNMSLYEVLEDTILEQAVVEIINDTTYKTTDKFYLFKVKTSDNINVIAGQALRDVSTIYTNGSSIQYMFSYDYENKNAIYYLKETGRYHEEHCIKFNTLKYLLDDKYTVYSNKDINASIYSRFLGIVTNLLDANFDKYMSEFEGYRRMYRTCVANSDHVERIYMADSKITYEVHVVLPKEYSCNYVTNLHMYLLDNSVIDEYAKAYFDKNTTEFNEGGLLYTHARIYAYNKIIDGFKNKPTERILRYNTIKKAISGAGKTLNIVTKYGETYKVENDILNTEEFVTVKGCRFINIADITKITFGRNTLFEL